MTTPHIVALGGTLRAQSSTARLLSAALARAEARGARTTLLTGPDIVFPHFEPEHGDSDAKVMRFVETLRSADAVLIGSPGYHGTISGLVKTALDYVELLSRDDRVYFDGMPVGLIATAAGWQASVSTLQALRTITHALRGWPTPMGIAVNTVETPDVESHCQASLDVMVGQIFDFLKR
ncbi:NADPH-dependent oxidoreductase [Sphingomonas sp. ABOLD]|uniref:FMN reductase n=1 Tax=Sphingomonas trueperi TaxID=53317 RepID=A0A7X5XVR9_9SPHN|nr:MULTISPECIES: NAD(P)H-dependent oxidoreductase [Sphingomonas]NJB96262.1 FMN reductase [Sphingomonas trueperi]RSV32895.1 NADPH-dependent oxidoreductase [Sphingomonas sp. ABOLE]RSV36726.1 NADPH-dependent oxidoreductase [Sphingomonas sp. ABOLD]